MSYDATKAFIKAMNIDANREKIIENLKKVSLPIDETSGSEVTFTKGERNNIKPVLIRVTGKVNSNNPLEFGYELVE
jgi:ABC-type branched-subunit amino acid transport system substrate-binding protein